MGDEDEEQGAADSGGMNITKYNVMPSLVSLMQMRNRLHLAFLGKKLMKWTALATGKELRRLSMEMGGLLTAYIEDFREAFIILSRTRYFVDGLNTTVLEGLEYDAPITVKSTARSVAGVKVRTLTLLERGDDAYHHLGMSRGGEMVKICKETWLALLRMMVLLVQFRSTFDLIDIAHKNATKKQNVLQRCIIPKIIITIRYIISELDEQEREESFRLKRFKQLKYKNVETDKDVPPEAMPEKRFKEVPEEETTDLITQIRKVVRMAEDLEQAGIPPENYGFTNCDIERLKSELRRVIDLHADQNKEKLCLTCEDVGRIVSTCVCDEVKLDQTGSSSDSDSDERKSDKDSEHHSVRSAEKPMPPPRIEPERPIPEKPSKPKHGGDPKGGSKRPMQSSRLDELEVNVDKVICMTHFYQGEGLLSKSAEEFLKCCESVKTRIQDFKQNRKVTTKLDTLKEQLSHLEKLTDLIQKEELSTTTIGSFMSCCKEFKATLERHKTSKGAPSVCSIEKLLNQIDESIVLSIEAKKEGLVSESVEQFIQSCKEIKSKIEPCNEQSPQVIDNLLLKVNTIVEFLSKYKEDGLVSESIEKFYNSCETTKARLECLKACKRRTNLSCHQNPCPRAVSKTPPSGSFIRCTCGGSVSGHSCGTKYAAAPIPQMSIDTPCGPFASNSNEEPVPEPVNTCKAKCSLNYSPPPVPSVKTVTRKPEKQKSDSNKAKSSQGSKSTCVCNQRPSQESTMCTKAKCVHKLAIEKAQLETAVNKTASQTEEQRPQGPKPKHLQDSITTCCTCDKKPVQKKQSCCKNNTSLDCASVCSCCPRSDSPERKQPCEPKSNPCFGRKSPVPKSSHHSIKECRCWETAMAKQQAEDNAKPKPSADGICTTPNCQYKPKPEEEELPDSEPNTNETDSDPPKKPKSTRKKIGPKKSVSNDSCDCVVCGAKSKSVNSIKIVVPIEGKKDPKQGYFNKSMSTMTSVRTYKEKDGRTIEETETVTLEQRVLDQKKEPIPQMSTGAPGSTESLSTMKVNICEVPVTKGFTQTMRNVKSETLIRSFDLSYSNSPFLWPSVSADTLTLGRKSNESEESGQQDSFLSESVSSSHDDPRSGLPM